MNRANYLIERNDLRRPLLIRDVGPWDKHPTITNDAEAVVEDLVAKGVLPEGRELRYIDSEGREDILLHRGGHFIGFAPGGTP